MGKDAQSLLLAQADAVATCHEADIRAFAVCAAHQGELVQWVKARKVPPAK